MQSWNDPSPVLFDALAEFRLHRHGRPIETLVNQPGSDEFEEAAECALIELAVENERPDLANQYLPAFRILGHEIRKTVLEALAVRSEWVAARSTGLWMVPQKEPGAAPAAPVA